MVFSWKVDIKTYSTSRQCNIIQCLKNINYQPMKRDTMLYRFSPNDILESENYLHGKQMSSCLGRKERQMGRTQGDNRTVSLLCTIPWWTQIIIQIHRMCSAESEPFIEYGLELMRFPGRFISVTNPDTTFTQSC